MNIYDIAKEAGVSIATVSRVLNNHPNVTARTRDRVVTVLERHNYVPSSVAKSLVNKATGAIGVMALDIRHMHYANIAYTIEQKLSSYGYHAIFCNTGYDRSKMDEYIRILAEKQVDGVIMVGSVFSCDETGRSVEKWLKGTPIVMHNTELKGEKLYNISTEEAHGIVLGMDHLIQKRGLQDIAFVQDYDTTVGRQKHEAYKNKLEQYGIPYRKELAVRTFSGLDGGIRAIEELSSRKARYSAIIGCDDITCLGAMRQMARDGRRIPDDIAVIDYNNTLFSQISDPPMTVVDNREETSGIMLARAMADILRGRDVPSQTLIYPELILRESA